MHTLAYVIRSNIGFSHNFENKRLQYFNDNNSGFINIIQLNVIK